VITKMVRLAGSVVAVLLLVAGPASAQTSGDDCYPIPEDGCFTDEAGTEGVADEGVVDGIGGTDIDGDESIQVTSVEETQASGDVLATTGGSAQTMIAVGLLALLSGVFILHRRRRAGDELGA
jgi:LPXTG-motif cell wall-anchored protein